MFRLDAPPVPRSQGSTRHASLTLPPARTAASLPPRPAHLHLKGEVLVQVLDDHDQEGQLDAQRLGGVGGARDEGGGHVGPRNLAGGGGG